MKNLLLVDGNSISYAVDVNNYDNPKDYAKAYFNRIIFYSEKAVNSFCKFVLFFDDKQGLTWRDKLFEDYQKDRKSRYDKVFNDKQKHESNLRKEYLNYIKESINNSKYSYVSYPHTEADDMIALYCNLNKEQHLTILTTDQDLLQLIDNNISVYIFTKRKMYKNINEGKKALEKKILLGDASDSIPSVCKGVGEGYYEDFKHYLKILQDNKINCNEDINKIKEVMKENNAKYIKSFSNFDVEQLRINKKLIDLKNVIIKDEKENNIKTNFIISKQSEIIIPPFSLKSIKLK